ncbi:hypothetical protein MIND_01267400 [Mycena indigotica]|uniref:Cytochrome P450 n=1 Tax=Mycena indigotica TaxID=2126181 RepID=A0A8H6S3L8_9AGAR|nr:uncharacterized protein MIND_01267400 [Mycena indigotica]KAF7291237.1 hypothetical protein MIND_01267400 [Mycena indigotica]
MSAQLSVYVAWIGTATRIVLPIVATLSIYLVYHGALVLYSEITSPFRAMRGPPNGSLLMGNFKQMAEKYDIEDAWRRQYGRIFKLRTLFSVPLLHVQDVKAISHMLSNGNVYQKSPVSLENTKQVTGIGLLAVEGEDHKRHRRILNQAFGYPQIRLLTETFVEKAILLREVWLGLLSKSPAKEQGQVIDVYLWLRRMTLDVIGQAGFNYEFDALQIRSKKPNELNEAFTQLFHSPSSRWGIGYRLARSMVPILSLVPYPGLRTFNQVRATMFRVGSDILARSKGALGICVPDASRGAGSKVGLEGKRDLLSILLRANVDPDVPARQRLSDEEVISQIPTFLIAGHETTSTAVSWALYALAHHPKVQRTLREELLQMSAENPTMDELNALPYLDLVVREFMRFHSPVTSVQRMAMQDDLIPLASPYIDEKGNSHESLLVPKGQRIFIPLAAVNRDPEIWGDDANEFRPERWEHIPDAASAVPNVWANQLTFFAGTHNCIGFRFALVEIKALLFVLIRAFEFALDPTAGPTGGIVPTAGVLQRPRSTAKATDLESSLPLMVKPYSE